MTHSVRSILLATAAVAVLSVPAAAQSVISFGDSLSDTGNLFAVTRGAQPASPPYFQGRFSNGPVFTEVLAGGVNSMQTAGARALLGVPVNPNASQNYAFGAAVTGLTPAAPAAGSVPVGIRSQIEAFARADGRFAPGDVVTLLGGANNLRGALLGGSPAAVPGATAVAVTDIALASGRLAQLGAPTVAVLTLPDLSLTPEVRAAGPVAGSLASQATQGFNGGVARAVSSVAAAAPGTNFHLVDVQPLFAEIVADPARFGFTNVSQACLGVAACASGDAATQAGFLFYDSIHPTALGHQLLADLVTDHLTAGARAGDAASLSEVALADRLAGEDALRERARRHLGATNAIPQGADIVEPGFGDPAWGNAYLSLEGAAFDRQGSSRLSAYDHRSGTVRAGVDYRLSDGFLLGGAVSASQGEVRHSPLTYDTQSFSADLYGTAVYGPAFVTLTGGVAHFDFEEFQRRTAVAGLVHRAPATNGFAANVGAEVGTTFALGAFTATPTLGLTYAYFDVDGFAETGSAARIVYGGYDRDLLNGAANLHLAYSTGFGEITGRIGYEDVLSDGGNTAIVSSIAGSPARASLAGFDDLPGRGLILGAGANVAVTETLTLDARYSVGFGDEIDVSHIGAVSLGYRF